LSFRAKQKLSTAAIYACLIVVTVIVLLPLLVIASSSFKDEVEIFAFPMTIIPENPILTNFERLADNFPLYIFNSFKVTIIIVLVQLLTATTGGYAFSKLRWPGRDLVFLTYVASIMVPIQAIIVPQFTIVRNIGLYDSHTALVVVSAFTAFGTFLVKQFFTTVPDSLLESARIDGASEYQIFGRIMIPLSQPVLATLVIFSFRWFWNDFFTPLIYITSQELKTLPLGMADFVTQYFTYYGPQMAAALISIIPVMAVFLGAQRYFVEGIVTTGIK
jgi:multiple sugar transport system permease protein